jgi:hypothetical protein
MPPTPTPASWSSAALRARLNHSHKTPRVTNLTLTRPSAPSRLCRRSYMRVAASAVTSALVLVPALVPALVLVLVPVLAPVPSKLVLAPPPAPRRRNRRRLLHRSRFHPALLHRRRRRVHS